MTQKNKAILYIISSAFCFALMNVFVRMAGDLPSVQKSFFRNLVALCFALIILLRSKEGITWSKSNLGLFIIRSIFGTLGILFNFYAVDHLLLSDASMLSKLAPFFAIIFSFFALREKIKPMQIIAILIAFMGALLIIKPGFAFDTLIPSLIGALGGMSAGAAYTTVRCLGQRGERGPFIVLFFSSFSCVVTLPFLIFNFHPMSLWQTVSLLLAGLAAAGGQFSVTAAYTDAPASEISVYDYTQVVFSAIFGFFFFHQLPDGWSILGYIIICGVSVAMYYYNKSISKN